MAVYNHPMRSELRKALASCERSVPLSISRKMRSIRKSGTSPELRLRLGLARKGVSGWIVNCKEVEGNPDLMFWSQRLAVFVDGCFWHGCPICGHTPQRNNPFWTEKFRTNRRRDKQVNRALRMSGIEVMRFWEHQILNGVDACVERISSRLS